MSRVHLPGDRGEDCGGECSGNDVANSESASDRRLCGQLCLLHLAQLQPGASGSDVGEHLVEVGGARRVRHGLRVVQGNIGLAAGGVHERRHCMGERVVAALGRY